MFRVVKFFRRELQVLGCKAPIGTPFGNGGLAMGNRGGMRALATAEKNPRLVSGGFEENTRERVAGAAASADHTMLPPTRLMDSSIARVATLTLLPKSSVPSRVTV